MKKLVVYVFINKIHNFKPHGKSPLHSRDIICGFKCLLHFKQTKLKHLYICIYIYNH